MGAATEGPAWKTILTDSFGLILVVWAIPAAMLLVGAPIALVFALVRWLL